MDTLADLFKKIETPISFASHDDYSRLALVKDLEKGMTALAAQLLRRLPASSGVAGQGEALVRRLGELFSGFDGLPLAEKRERIAAAREQLLAIRSLLQPPLPPHRKEDGAAGQDLDQPLQSLPGIGPRLSVLLGRKHLITIRDLLFFLPRRYEDRRRVSRIADTDQGGRHTVVGRIAKAEMRSYGRRRVFEVTVKEGDSLLKAKWFHGREAFFRQIFQPDRRLILTGTVRPSPLDREMLHPEFEVLDEQEDQSLHFRRIVPFYSETEGIPQKRIRRLLWQAVRDYGPLLESPIPDPLCKKRQLIGISKAIKQVHFPEDQEDPLICEARRSAGHRRLIYEELFLFQLGLALVRQERQQEQGIAFRLGGPLLTRFLTGLPFPLTAAQQRVIREIERDMAAPQPMSRLLQGDVGSGKTVVAMAAMVIACENGHQTVLMAPTEILAEQHFRNLKPWAERLGLRLQLLTGGCCAEQKTSFHSSLKEGEIDIAVGTHALLQQGIGFDRLGLVIIDEQHRFGVLQRSLITSKGGMTRPDCLVMTATPIPRTLSMTAYGDLDVSVIDELPPGRTGITTKVFTEAQRPRVYHLIRQEIERGRQAFLVYPLVAESEGLDLKDASGMAAHLQQEVFPDFQVGLIHGRLSPKEKERVMEAFLEARTQLLVATTVIEVGIDIPRASVMVIEHADRFGLSQLHQLRGRIGRGDWPSFCLLLTQQGRSAEAHRRLAVMEATSDGFRIAEEDLALRGPGEFLGTRQSGLPDFKIANIASDLAILNEARDDALALVAADPRLEGETNASLRLAIKEHSEEVLGSPEHRHKYHLFPLQLSEVVV